VLIIQFLPASCYYSIAVTNIFTPSKNVHEWTRPTFTEMFSTKYWNHARCLLLNQLPISRSLDTYVTPHLPNMQNVLHNPITIYAQNNLLWYELVNLQFTHFATTYLPPHVHFETTGIILCPALAQACRQTIQRLKNTFGEAKFCFHSSHSKFSDLLQKLALIISEHNSELLTYIYVLHACSRNVYWLHW